MTSMTRFQVLNFSLAFSVLVAFEILSLYPTIDSSYWQKEDVHWITDIFLRENLMVSKGFDLFFLHFFTEFWFSPVFFLLFS